MLKTGIKRGCEIRESSPRKTRFVTSKPCSYALFIVYEEKLGSYEEVIYGFLGVREWYLDNGNPRKQIFNRITFI